MTQTQAHKSKSKPKSKPMNQIALRLSEGEIRGLDDLAERMSAASGIRFSRSDVIRVSIAKHLIDNSEKKKGKKK